MPFARTRAFERRRLRIVVSTLVVITIGSLLHFAWEWSARSPAVAIFAATNESTWEHLKLAFWPAFVVGLVQRRLYCRPPGWIVATALRTLTPPILIVLLFYGYIALLGRNFLLLDISVFVVAVFAGECLGHGAMWTQMRLGVRVGAGVVLAMAVVAFATLSFRPPACFLFEDPTQRVHEAATCTRGSCGHATSDYKSVCRCALDARTLGREERS
jgi:hypothetical protein